MKAYLMYRDRDFDPQQGLPNNEPDLSQDLELDRLLDAMAGGDDFVRNVVRVSLLAGLTDPEEIRYRQRVLIDCLDHPAVLQELYALTVQAIVGERRIYGGFLRHPGATLGRSVNVLQMFLPILRRLRRLADEHAPAFVSDGFAAFFRTLSSELDDEYFRTVDDHLRRLSFRRGVLVSARLGIGNRGEDYVLRRPHQTGRGLLKRIGFGAPTSYTFRIPDRDENGVRALSELRDRGLNLAADALAQSVDHLLSFFRMLHTELAFYLGCLNLHDRLTSLTAPTCLPVPEAAVASTLACRDLYDVSLALTMNAAPVGNDVDTAGLPLVMITGANRGGKSTFLRSVGLAQLMMQAGMFAPARAFTSSICAGLFTHYRREEDPSMTSGKFDEELARMSSIVDQASSTSLLLCNESFASTNEREGAEIARHVIGSLVDAGLRVLIVTHLYDLAHRWYTEDHDGALFLRAERHPGGHRSFRLIAGEPLPTSYGEDLYQRIFQTPSPQPG